MMLDRSRQGLLPYAWALAALVVSLSTVALVVSCTGPLPDTCDPLGTCGPVDAGPTDAGPVDAGNDREADVVTDDAADVASESVVCDPTKAPKYAPCALDNAYGVFVASPVGGDGGPDAGAGGLGSGSGDGSMSQPYATITQALANLGGKTRIYVCNGLYSEQVSVTTAVSVYGGLSCARGSTGRVWTYTGASAEVRSPSPAYALSVTGVSSGVVTFEDVSFGSPTATVAGSSSIAALIASSSVKLSRVRLSPGNGATGADGAVTPNYTGPAPSGGAQVWSSPGGLFGAYSGGAGGVNRCLQFGSSAGGDGGLGCATGLGTAGTASPQAPVTMAGRDGLPMGVSPVGDGGAAMTATANDPGADGVAGEGVAAPSQVYGALSPTGWTPSSGGDGAPGKPGQGGAGATDPLYGLCTNPMQSIGGGGGGAGGCGGAGGKGGGGGGASIALASVQSTVNLTDCILIAAAAGTGGSGGAGQDGQAGGPGGDDSSFPQQHAPGAPGGNGAGGSGGAGGTGGISVGILSMGSTITSDAATSQSTMLGPPGAGGVAGAGGRHSLAGVLTTGMDGRSGAPGSAGTSVALLKLM